MQDRWSTLFNSIKPERMADNLSAATPAAADLGSRIASVARTHADLPALWAHGECLTYRELAQRAARIGRALTQQGIGPDDRVAILSERGVMAYVAILAVLFAGAAYVPLNVRFPTGRNRRIVESSGARALICSAAQSEMVGEVLEGVQNIELLLGPESGEALPLPVKQLIAADLDVLPADLHALPCESNPGRLAYLFFTSGTTGAPKGVPISHENVAAYLRGIGSVAKVSAGDRIMQVVDLTFDLSVHDIFTAWTSGACLFSIPENGSLLGSRFVEEHSATHWLAVPSTAALMKQAGLLTPGCMPSLKYSFFCGEALPGSVAEAWAAAAPNSQVFNIYGPTEATVAFSSYRYLPGEAAPPAIVSLGKPFPEQRMGLFDEGGDRADGVGEICLSGTQLTEGYWNAPALTDERFFEAEGHRWYRTGDVGRYVEGEGYAYLGRADRQVKIRGYRVELQEIENAIREATDCDLAAVVPWPLDNSGSALGCVAFAVGGTTSDDPLERCRERLPDYMVPSELIAIEEMPLNANGKIDHRALAQLLQGRSSTVATVQI